MTKTKENIRAIAFRHFLEGGYTATNLRDIAKEAGIRAASIYFHYESKQALFLAIYRELLQASGDRSDKAIRELSGRPPEQALALLFDRLVEDSIHYAVELRFILRYTQFPDFEVLEDVLLCLNEFAQRDLQRFEPLLSAYIAQSPWLQGMSPEEAASRYRRFCHRCVLEIAMTGIATPPSERAVLWEVFSRHELPAMAELSQSRRPTTRNRQEDRA